MSWLHRLSGRNTSSPAISGGLRLPRYKPGLPDGGTLSCLQVPEEIVIPLIDYHRNILSPMVRAGQRINMGDALASGIIAPASGIVTGVEARPIIHPSLRTEPCVVIRTDSAQINTQPIFPALTDKLDRDRIARCGVQGLGGAGFTTAEKLFAAVQKAGNDQKHTVMNGIDTLIINAVECEPGISCDEALMMTEAGAVVEAIANIMATSNCRRCILAVEDDKTAAIAALRDALENSKASNARLELRQLAPIYPSGAERPLIQQLIGKHVADGVRPSDLGIVCLNVATAVAVWRAQLGYPLIARVVTIGGQRAANPTNVNVLLGTSVREVLRQTANEPATGSLRIRAGGPLSGFDLQSLDVPIGATTNCIAIEESANIPVPRPCIRCSACSDVCPVDLLPQQLYWYASKDDLVKSAHYGLDRCIKCGCCDVVCPSHIPLTQTFRYAHDAQREQHRLTRVAAEAEERYRLRERRLVQRAALREGKRKAAKSILEQGADPIAAALERARSKRRKKTSPSGPDQSR